MRYRKTELLSVVIITAVLIFFEAATRAGALPDDSFLAGTAKIRITPEIPIPMSGYGGRTAPFNGVHDDLYARVIVFSDGTNKAVLISADLIGFSNSFWEETTLRITNETGIKKEFVLLAAVHNHGVPVTKVYGEDSSVQVNTYVEELQNKIIIATKDAIGEDLGLEAMRVSKEIQPLSAGKISALQRVISLPSKEKDSENYLQPDSKNDDDLIVRLSAIKIGNIVFTGVSGELFNQISVNMRNQSPYSNTFMITHCNGSSGYLVTDDSFPKDGTNLSVDKYHPTGGYEVNSSRAKQGAEKVLIENLLEMINEL